MRLNYFLREERKGHDIKTRDQLMFVRRKGAL